MVQSPPRPVQAVNVPRSPVECTVLTLSGTVVARGRMEPRRPEYLAEAYSVCLSEVEPRGALEAMVYASQPAIILRPKGQPELQVRIDHITGAPQQRAFFCHTG